MDSHLKLLTQEIHPFEDYFPKLHHFSNAKFSSQASSFEEFVNYGKSVANFNEGENKRTVERSLMAVKLAKHGISIDDAINKAWLSTPLATR